jgi:hypothetical protein
MTNLGQIGFTRESPSLIASGESTLGYGGLDAVKRDIGWEKLNYCF